jgi:hypothetical protein
MSEQSIKQCPNCGQQFTIDDLLNNTDIRPKGLALESDDLSFNMFYFDHNVIGCGTTFVVPVETLAPYIEEPIPDELLAGTDTCERHCLKIEDWAECSQACSNAPYRRFLLSLASRRGLAIPTA